MWMIGAWLAAGAADAHGRAMAVLELQKGAGSAEHEGLGKGLAGMILSDLVGLPDLDLVERDRIDALKDELALGAAGFLDPSTAAKAGKAIGADLWLVGSYNVVGGTIQMDARLIDAKTQKVLEAAAANGPLADWVGVEKQLVEGVVADLGIAFDPRAKREFYARVPTEDFGAFASYSLGLSEQEKGEFAEAEAAFRAAVAKDPAFTEALTSISALKDVADRARVAEEARAAGARTDMVAKVLASTPDPRAHQGPWSAADLVAGPVRWAVLLESGGACQRLEEMQVVMAGLDWQPQKAIQANFTHQNAFRTKAEAAARAAGFVAWDPNRPHPDRAVSKAMGDREVRLFESPAAFLFHNLDTLSDTYDAGMASSLLACRGGNAAVAALEGWQRELAARQLLAVPASDVMSIQEMLVVLRAWFEADTGTVSADTRAKLEALVAATPEGERREVISLVDKITRHATDEERWRLSALGMTVTTIRGRLEAMAGRVPPFRTTPAWCASEADRFWRGEAARLIEMWNEAEDEARRPEHAVQFSAVLVRSAADMGCFDGQAARLTSWLEAKSFLRASASRTHPNAASDTSCAPRVNGSLGMLSVADDTPAQLQGTLVYGVLSGHYAMVQARCLVEMPPK